MLRASVVLALLAGASTLAAQTAERPWLDRTRAPDARAEAVVAAMAEDGKLNLVFDYATGEQVPTTSRRRSRSYARVPARSCAPTTR
jgi:hypothetical protein